MSDEWTFILGILAAAGIFVICWKDAGRNQKDDSNQDE